MNTKKQKRKAKQRATERKLLEAQSSQSYRYTYAHEEIDKAGSVHMMASGVLLQLTALGGRELINPVVIRDGLNKETIDCIKRELRKSQQLATAFKISSHNPEQ